MDEFYFWPVLSSVPCIASSHDNGVASVKPSMIVVLICLYV
jgi:hypothetical protein